MGSASFAMRSAHCPTSLSEDQAPSCIHSYMEKCAAQSPPPPQRDIFAPHSAFFVLAPAGPFCESCLAAKPRECPISIALRQTTDLLPQICTFLGNLVNFLIRTAIAGALHAHLSAGFRKGPDQSLPEEQRRGFLVGPENLSVSPHPGPPEPKT